MANKQYLNAFINNSATIREQLAADITDASHRAVAYDSSGKLVLPAADGEAALGILLSDTNADNGGITKAGTEVDVLIKNIGLVLEERRPFDGDGYGRCAKSRCRKLYFGHCNEQRSRGRGIGANSADQRRLRESRSQQWWR